MWARVVVQEVARHVTRRGNRRRPEPSPAEFAGGNANHATGRVSKVSGSWRHPAAARSTFVPGGTQFVSGPDTRRDESLGYCLSPGGFFWLIRFLRTCRIRARPKALRAPGAFDRQVSRKARTKARTREEAVQGEGREVS